MNKKQHQSTKVVHAGLGKSQNGEPFIPGPVFASTFHLSGDTNGDTHQYARHAHPTWDVLEKSIGELEMGKVLIFPSGMAAAAAVMTSILKKGDSLLLASDGYHTTRSYAENFLLKFGVNVKTLPTSQIPEADFSSVKLVFIETPSNPMLDVVDIKKLAKKFILMVDYWR
ncbi:MAG: PLP-dependent transferase [Alcanivoracaceae bacterium]|nr:PLP-dependent transferase [Alcanivoracaceae bacterium]